MIATDFFVRRQRQEGPTHALLVASRATDDLIETLSTLDLLDPNLALYPVSARGGPRKLVGLFVPLHGDPPTLLPPRVEAFTRVGTRLFHPTHARLAPPITAEECDEVCAARVHVLHPVHGVCGFDADEAIDLTGLLVPTERSETTWDKARTGVAAPPPLTQVLVVLPPSEEVLGATAQDDIGTVDPPPKIRSQITHALGDPQRPDRRRKQRDRKQGRNRKEGRDRKDGRTKSRSRSSNPFSRMLARGILRVTSRIPATADQPTIFNRLEDWALSKFASAAQRLESGSNAVEWLLQKLREDPDAGLTHALPTHGQGGRGQGEPFDGLPHRDPEFEYTRLGRSGDSGPGTIVVADELYYELQKKYRELAQRELDLGRAKRAAYIFAELLGDMRAAAKALEDGGEYLDAAALYRHECDDRRAAAQCLEKGGYKEEAIELYQELLDYRAAGKLFRELGRSAEAAAEFAKQVKIDLRLHRMIAAAEVVENELCQPEWAMTILMDGFRRDIHREPCLRRWFEVAARHGQHETALHQIEQTRRAGGGELSTLLTRVMARQAKSFPDPRVAAAAADTCRVLAGAAMLDPHHSTNDMRGMLDCVGLLAGNDDQLRRDVKQFADSIRAKPLLLGSDTVLDADHTELGTGVPIAHATAEDGVLLVFCEHDMPRGRKEPVCRLVSVTGAGVHIEATWQKRMTNGAFLFCEGKTSDRVVIIPKDGSYRVPMLDRHEGARVGTPNGTPNSVVAAAQLDSGRIAMLVPDLANRALLFTQMGFDGASHRQVSVTPDPDWQSLVAAVALPSRFVFASDRKLFSLDMHGRVTWDLPAPYGVHDVVRLHGRENAIVACVEEGCVLLQPLDNGAFDSTFFAGGHERPHVGPLRNGLFVVADTRHADVYRLDPHGPVRIRRLPLPGMPHVVGLIQSPAAEELYVLARRADRVYVLNRCRAPA